MLDRKVPRFAGPARQRAVLALDGAVEMFERTGAHAERVSPLEAKVQAGKGAFRLEMTREGKVFGGNYALEISTAEPVLPRTQGLSMRARGVVRMQGLRVRARRGDAAGTALGERLGKDTRLAELLGGGDFERIRVDPD